MRVTDVNIKPNLLLLKVLCIAPDQNDLLSICIWFLCFISMSFMFLFQIIYLLYQRLSITDVAFTFSTIPTTFQGAFQVFEFKYRRDLLQKLLNVIKFDFWPTYIGGPKLEKEFFREAKLMVYLMGTYLFWIMVIITGYGVMPLFDRHKFDYLPYPAWSPFDMSSSPWHEITFAWEMITSAWGVAFMICGGDCLLCNLIMATTQQLRLLQSTLTSLGQSPRNGEMNCSEELIEYFDRKDCEKKKKKYIPIKENPEERAYRILRLCVIHHCRLIEFSEDIQFLYKNITAMHYIASTLAICVSAFVIRTQANSSLTFNLIEYCLIHLMQLFVLCTAGTSLQNHSEKVAKAAYSCGWFNRPFNKMRQGLIMIIQRAQRPQKIATAYGIATLQYESFTSVIKSSFSYMTVLYSVNFEDKDE